jgi:hypothetical protein
VPVNQFFVGPVVDDYSCVSNPDGTVTLPATTVNLRDNSHHLGDALPYDLPALTVSPPQGQSFAVAKFNAGSPAFFVITDVEEINESDVAPIVTIFRSGNELHIIDWDGIASGLPNRLHQRSVKTRRFEAEPGGLALSVDGSLHFFLTAGRVWYGAVRQMLLAFQSTTDECDLWYFNGSAWVTLAITTYNNTQYATGSALATLANNKWTVNWVYRGVENSKHCIVVLGPEFAKAAEANESSEPSLPDIVVRHMLLVGRIIVQKGSATPIVQSAFLQRFSPGGASNHEYLSGLLGALIGNHYHFADFATVAAAEAAAGGTAGAVAFVLAERTWYRYDSNPSLTRNGTSVLNTAEGGTTRWVAFAGRWQVFQYDDVYTDALTVPGGATAPDQEAVPGAPNISVFAFDGGNTVESLSGTFELLHGYREGSDLWPHVHWSPRTGAAGNVRWVFEYIVRTNTGEFSAPAVLTAVQAAGGLGPNGRPIQHNVEFSAAIPGAGLVIGTQIRFVLRREPANAADTYGGDALLWAVGLHYEKDSAGSLQRFVK